MPRARAQDHENKLVDRLLRPDMTLVNSAQNKKFVAAEGTSVDRKFEAKSFYVKEKTPSKPFQGLRDFFAKAFGAGKFDRAEAAPDVLAKTESVAAHTKFHTRSSSLVHSAAEQNKVAKTREYAASRPFLGKGTRQEVLSQQSRPLSIEEVRELLNKNE